MGRAATDKRRSIRFIDLFFLHQAQPRASESERLTPQETHCHTTSIRQNQNYCQIDNFDELATPVARCSNLNSTKLKKRNLRATRTKRPAKIPHSFSSSFYKKQ